MINACGNYVRTSVETRVTEAESLPSDRGGSLNGSIISKIRGIAKNNGFIN